MQEGGGSVVVVVGDVARERVAVVALSFVTWHERGAGGGVDVGGMAVERAAVLTWNMKRQRQRLAPTVTWHVVGLWMHDELGGGGQRGGATHLWTPFPGLLALPTSSWSSNLALSWSLNRFLSSCA
jgi:hypothetical protein